MPKSPVRPLLEHQKILLKQYVDGGAPEFDKASLPEPLTAPPSMAVLKPTFESIKSNIFDKKYLL